MEGDVDAQGTINPMMQQTAPSAEIWDHNQRYQRNDEWLIDIYRTFDKSVRTKMICLDLHILHRNITH